SLNEDLSALVKGLSFQQEFDLSTFFIGNYNQIRNLATFQPVDSSNTVGYIQYGDQTTFDIDEGGSAQWNRVNVAISGRYVKQFGNSLFNALVSYRQDELNNGE